MKMRTSVRKIALRLMAWGTGLLAVAAMTLWFSLRGSLPSLAGTVSSAHVTDRVEIRRDGQGVPVIRAASRSDVAFGLGFSHAQDRFFQMDLLRRESAGELAEVFGRVALERDKLRRLHQLRDRASAIVARLKAQDLAILQAYCDGVNAGLASLSVRPPEYLIMRESPSKWTPADTVLVGYSLFFALTDADGELDLARGFFAAKLSDRVYPFLFRNESAFEAPVDDSGPQLIPPPPELKIASPVIDNRRAATGFDRPMPGSNLWAVGGNLTSGGAGMLANDLHLPLGVPNLWYRASFQFRGRSGAGEQVVGATIPGLPFMVIGSNGRVAWGVSNSPIDVTDLALHEVDPNKPGVYRTPSGERAFEVVREAIKVRGASTEVLEIRKTIWGPVRPKPFMGKIVSLRWTAHDESAFNLRFIDLETATSAADALGKAKNIAGPPLNLMASDVEGHIGWTMIGVFPIRSNFDGRIPQSFVNKSLGWECVVGPSTVPQILDPAHSRIWNGNNRMVRMPPDYVEAGFANGARASRIKQRLFDRQLFDESEFLAIQHDIGAAYYERWRVLLLGFLAKAGDERSLQLSALVAAWDGMASADSPAFAHIRMFRDVVVRRTTTMFLGSAKERPDISLSRVDLEEPCWLYWEAQRNDAVGREARDAFMVECLQHAYGESDKAWGKAVPLRERVWGHRNRLHLTHPISPSLPFVGRMLDMPTIDQSGDVNVPLVARPRFGASIRFVVSPGRESDALFQMPGGQSGHPLSPHYRDQFDDWTSPRPALRKPGNDRVLVILPNKSGN